MITKEAGRAQTIPTRLKMSYADFYHLDGTGVYTLFATEDDEGVESKVLPGFWLRPDWIRQDDTLNSLMAFFEMRCLSTEQIEQIQHMLRAEETD